MKIHVTLCLLTICMLPPVSAFGESNARDRCRFAVAESLPKAPGLEILSFDATDMGDSTFQIKARIKFAGEISEKMYLCRSAGVHGRPAIMEQ